MLTVNSRPPTFPPSPHPSLALDLGTLLIWGFADLGVHHSAELYGKVTPKCPEDATESAQPNPGATQLQLALHPS